MRQSHPQATFLDCPGAITGTVRSAVQRKRVVARKNGAMGEANRILAWR
jgi:hypothetical protein